MGPGRLLPLAVLAVLFSLALVWVLSEGAEAADRDIFGDWVIPSGTTTVINETVDVRGSVIVPNGAVLTLRGCELAINTSTNGGATLEVRDGGRLEVYDSLVYGNNARMKVSFDDVAMIERSTIRNIQGSYTDHGISLTGGLITIKDSVIEDSNYHGLYVQTDTTLTNVTIRDIYYSNVYVYNYGAGAPFTLTMTDCLLVGSGSANYYGGVYVYAYGQGEQVTVDVTSTRFESLYRGAYIYSTGMCTVTMEGCTFEDCNTGVYTSYSTGGSFTLRNNVIANGTGAGSIGMYIRMGSGVTNVLDANKVKNVGLGYHLLGPYGGSYATSVGHLTVSDCTRGIRADASLTLTVHNSSLTGISDSFGCFVATNSSSITVIDTVHTKGSGTVDSTSWIKAYTEVEILGAKWKGGQAIAEGILVLENVTQVEVARFDLAALFPQDVAGWEVDSSGRRTSTYLYPAMYIDGHGFRGERFDIWDTVSRRIELVDDSPPETVIKAPLPGEGFATSTVVASGTYRELGSGIDRLEMSLDGAAFGPMTGWSEGNWTMPVSGLSDGDHTLAVRAVDRAGNLGPGSSVNFSVDTTVPVLILDPVPELVNTTSITISGTTEPLARLMVDGKEQVLDEDGSFSARLNLSEGRNTISVEVSDRAGNENSATIVVTLDSIPPTLQVTAPEGDVWTNARWVYVEGTTNTDGELLVQEATVTVVNGTFRRRVDLEDGTFRISVVATDRAGNSASAEVVLKVDWDPPLITIIDPEEMEVYVRESTVYIAGDVDDPTIDHVSVDGQTVSLTNGRFFKQFTVLEGVNRFEVLATDAAGNSGIAVVIVIRDLTPPTYTSNVTAIGGELLYIGGTMYSTASAVEVHLLIDEVSNITLGDGTSLPSGKEARVRFDLEEGSNELEVRIVDMAGNGAQTYRLRLTVDTIAPTIAVEAPAAGARTKEDTVTISGVTEAGSTLTINGETVQLGSGGRFSHVMALLDGRNEFDIVSKDAMGNTASTSVSVLRDAEVQASEISSTGAIFGGFLAGLVVGVVLATVLLVARGRRRERDEAVFLGEGPAPARPAAEARVSVGAPRYELPPEPAAAEEMEGWEEF